MFVAFLPILALQVKVEGPMSAVYVKVLDVNNQFFQGRSMQESAPSRFFGWLGQPIGPELPFRPQLQLAGLPPREVVPLCSK